MAFRRFFLISVFAVIFSHGKAQEMLGTVLGNYSGINAPKLNPSAMSGSKVYLDVNLIGFDIFAQNNYVYIDQKDYRFLHFFQSSYQYPQHSELYGTSDRMFYHYPGKDFRQAYVNIRIDGPGAMVAWGEHTFALTTAVRSVSEVYYSPYEIANFAYLGLNFKPQHNINFQDKRFFNSATLTWAEIGLSYSYPVYASGLNMVSLGISIRRLEGIAGGYLYSRDANYIVPDDSTITVRNLDVKVGYALPLNYDNNQPELGKLFKGGGFAGDIGATYYRLKNFYRNQGSGSFCSFQYRDYLYRIGLALIDAGAIRFKNHAEKYAIDNRSSYWTNVNHFDFISLHHLMDTVSYKFYGDYTSAYRGNTVWVWLPSALSAQFDYHFKKNWYINASVIYGFRFAPNTVIRPSEVSITPRYETSWFEANLPVSLYNWYQVRIGLSLRFYYVTIGTDKLGWFFHMNDFTGLDFYIALKFYLERGICGKRKQEGCTDSEYFHKKHSYR